MLTGSKHLKSVPFNFENKITTFVMNQWVNGSWCIRQFRQCSFLLCAGTFNGSKYPIDIRCDIEISQHGRGGWFLCCWSVDSGPITCTQCVCVGRNISHATRKLYICIKKITFAGTKYLGQSYISILKQNHCFRQSMNSSVFFFESKLHL